MIKILHIVPAEDQTIFYVTFYGTDQSLGDAVRSLGGITFFQTTEAVGDVLLLLCNFFKKGIVNRPARHTTGLVTISMSSFLHLHKPVCRQEQHHILLL